MGIKVLVVDDDNCCSEIFRKYLEFKKDWDIATIEDPIEALKLLSKEKFDVIVSDLKMPQMNGLMFLSQVSDKFPDTIRVLFTSAKIGQEKASYIHLQYEKGHFSIKTFAEKISKIISSKTSSKP